jgi:hypothetical protein
LHDQEVKEAWELWSSANLSAHVYFQDERQKARCSVEKLGVLGVVNTHLSDELPNTLFIDIAIMPTKRHGLGRSLVYHIAPFLDKWDVDRYLTRPITYEGKVWCHDLGFEELPGTQRKNHNSALLWELPLNRVADF